MNFSETIFLFFLALLVFGPKKLPEIARQVGKALNEFKRASNEFKAQIEAEIHQLEIQERTKKEDVQHEELQKFLPPAEPPAGAVHSAMPIAPDESSQQAPPETQSLEENLPGQGVAEADTDSRAATHDVSSPAQDVTNA
jgi:sec-independent protein translocase protein TatB